MAPTTFARAAAVLIFPLVLAPAAAEPLRPDNAVLDRTIGLVEEHFFSADALPGFRSAVVGIEARATENPIEVDAAIAEALASLRASHTGRYTQEQVDYYELADVFRYGLRRDLRRLFPSDGEVSYEGIGIASRTIDGKRFVTDVYDGGPADRAGLLAGDEILSVDGAPFAEIGSFRDKAGKTAAVEIRRAAGAEPTVFSVPVEKLEPEETFLKAISDSVRVDEQDGRKIGVIHLWMYTSDRVGGIINEELAGGRLKDVDGLILDLRSRWGGAPADAAEVFVGGTGNMTATERDGEINYVNTRWDKPVVAIIDEGSRSGMEIFAYALKKHGIPLVGVNTAKAVVAGTAFLLPDDSMLLLAVNDVHVDGKRLEGVGVAPDIVVPFDVRYANGADPQFDAALAEMGRVLDDDGQSVN